MFISLLASFSTTAIISLALVSLLVGFAPDLDKFNSDNRITNALGHSSGVKFFYFCLCFLICTTLIFFVTNEAVYGYIFEKLNNTSGYTDGNYSSGAERLYWDIVSLQAFIDSFGIGVGAGGTRASSFFVSVVANFGFPGAVLLSSLFIYLIRQVYCQTTGPYALERRVSSLFCIGWLLSMFVAMPDGLSSFYLWIQVGLLIGADDKLIRPNRKHLSIPPQFSGREYASR